MQQTDAEATSHAAVSSACLNPKSISLGELYGAYNPVSNDWKDGIASKLVRDAMADDSSTMKWLLFDGPVDAVWVENLNTVSTCSELCVSRQQQHDNGGCVLALSRSLQGRSTPENVLRSADMHQIVR